nr:C-Myc-binding protein homolog [Tanacetum cinerariifolium]
MEKEAKKEAFRKYLESSGVLDALTKVLVALYEQNDKPSSAVEFVQQKLGGPSLSEYEKLQAEMSDLQIRYNELLALHQEKSSQLEELRNTHTVGPSVENVEGERTIVTCAHQAKAQVKMDSETIRLKNYRTQGDS